MQNVLVVGKALSDANRLRTLMALRAHGELCACQIAEFLQITSATVSRHMSVLQSAGLIESRKDGRWVYYRLSEKGVKESRLADVLGWVFSILDNDPGISDDRRRLQEVTSCDASELCKGKSR